MQCMAHVLPYLHSRGRAPRSENAECMYTVGGLGGGRLVWWRDVLLLEVTFSGVFMICCDHSCSQSLGDSML